MISPKDYEKWYLPRYKELFEMIHKRGGRTMFHTDGDISELIPLYIEEGLDLLQGLEPAAGVDIIALNEKYGDKIAWNGNIDVSRFLWTGSPEEVSFKNLNGLCKVYSQVDSLVFGSCTDIMDFHPIDNIESMYRDVFVFDYNTGEFDYHRCPY